MSALAQLPIDPSWACQVESAEVRWMRETKTRRINVVWSRHSATQHEWRAWSEPIGDGRDRTLGGSSGPISCAQVEKQLKAFFAS
jgi:hypothetical protein